MAGVISERHSPSLTPSILHTDVRVISLTDKYEGMVSLHCLTPSSDPQSPQVARQKSKLFMQSLRDGLL